MQRLDFRLPDFTRVSWVSDRARLVWQPRLERIRASWREVEWLSVAAGVRECAVLSLPADSVAAQVELWRQRGLTAAPVGTEEAAPTAPARWAVGAAPDVADFQRAWQAGDDRVLGRMLGHPCCCLDFYRQVWVEQALEDTTWPMAEATVGRPGACQHEVHGLPQANILWRWLGLRAVPHLPCRFDCPATVALANRLLEIGRLTGHGQEVDWLLEVLSWPVEWSALHGIAEIKTPVLKVSTRTDATACKYVVQRAGSSYPPEGAQGLRFPYRLARQPLLTLSPAYRRGLENPLDDPGCAAAAPQTNVS
jgi:hypothetical protein